MHLPVDEINRLLELSPKGERGAIVERYCAVYKVSRFTIYRALRQAFGRKKVVAREKKIPDAVIHEAALLKRAGEGLHLAERELSSEMVIQILRDRQVEGAELLTVATLNRRLAERGYRERKPYVRVEAMYSNQQHQLDFSRSKYFQLVGYDQDKGDYLVKVSGKELHYKVEDMRLRTWLVCIVDSYSRLTLTQAYAARGEEIAMGLEHLNRVYNGEFTFDGERLYLPQALKTDNGAFAKHSSVVNMLKALDIKPELAEAYQHRGNQKVESQFRNHWQRFELPLAIKMGAGKTLFLSEYNELAQEFAASEAKRNHPLRPGTREHVYRSGLLLHEQRYLTDDFRDIAFKVIERTVNDALMVTINNEQFEAPRGTQGKRLKVYSTLNGEFAAEVIGDGDYKSFMLKPVTGFVELGNFDHRPKATYKQELDNELAAKRAAGKVTYLKPRTKRAVPDSPVHAAKEPFFSSVDEARGYALGKLGADVYAGYQDIFAEFFAEELKESGCIYIKGVDQMLGDIKKFTNSLAN